MSGNSALLAQIQQGKKLRKAETNDRSVPLVEGSKPSRGGGGVTKAGVASAPAPGAGGPPQLGGLFAGGIPKLKPAGQPPTGTLGKPPSITKRGGNESSTPGPPATPSRSAPPLPPSRELSGRAAPAPQQAAPTPSAPTPPRRPPPPARPVSPPPRRPPPPARPASPPSRPPALPARSVSPPPRPASSGPTTRPFRQITTSLSSSQSLSLPARKVPPPPTTSGRAPPPPPPRPSAIKTGTTPTALSQPARAVPAPPSRRNPQPHSEEETPPPQPARAIPPPPSRRNIQSYSAEEETSPSQPARAVPPPPSRRNPQPNSEEETPPPQPARAIPPPPSRRNPQPNSEEETPPPQPARAIPPPPSRRIPQETQEDEPAPSRARSVSTGGSGVKPTLPGPSPSKTSLVPPTFRPPPGAPPLGMRGASPGRRAVSVSNMNGGDRNGTKPVILSRIPSPPPSSGPHMFPTSSDFPPPRTFTRSAKKYASGNVRGSSFDVAALS